MQSENRTTFVDLTDGECVPAASGVVACPRPGLVPESDGAQVPSPMVADDDSSLSESEGEFELVLLHQVGELYGIACLSDVEVGQRLHEFRPEFNCRDGAVLQEYRRYMADVAADTGNEMSLADRIANAVAKREFKLNQAATKGQPAKKKARTSKK